MELLQLTPLQYKDDLLEGVERGGVEGEVERGGGGEGNGWRGEGGEGRGGEGGGGGR